MSAVDEVMSQAELDTLAHALAYELATSALEGVSIPIAAEEAGVPGEWLELSQERIEDDLGDMVQYLDARGLILRHPLNPKWIQFRDESEATR